MKRFVSLLVFMLVPFGAFSAQSGRPAMSHNIMSAPRYTASVNQLNSMGSTASAVGKTEAEEKDMREAERNACINNNIGIGNTFVWASKFSDVSNYANMVEDTVNPENNVCFVRVELKSDDASRVSVADIEPKYFMWGENIECGSWVNQKEMEQRILDARKGARIGGIVASTVGGAGLGVGAMELIGNTAIDGWRGQKDLEDEKLYRSVLLSYSEADRKEIMDDIRTIKQDCETNHSVDCSQYEKLFEELEDLL